MAGSRAEKYGTVFSRVTGLLRTGALKPSDKPVWYEVYAAFPPKVEPKYDRDVDPGAAIDILYREDFIRARFYKTYVGGGVIDMRKKLATPSISQMFINKYHELEAECEESEDSLFEKSTSALRAQGIRLVTVEDAEQQREARQQKYLSDQINERPESVADKPDDKTSPA